MYKEGNSDIDPYQCIIDPGCPKTVAGKKWMDSFSETQDKNVIIRRHKENENFKFGPSKVYNSKENYEINVNIGKMETTMRVSVVEADIPLLLGLDYQEKWGIVMDIEKRELFIKKSNEVFKIKSSKSTHWKLLIQNHKNLITEA